MIVDVLDSAVGQSHGVGALGVPSTVRRLGSVEVSAGVLTVNSVGEGVGVDPAAVMVVDVRNLVTISINWRRVGLDLQTGDQLTRLETI